MNGGACCILAVCCNPNSKEQIGALVSEMEKALGGSGDESYTAVAAWILNNFDLAPLGSLTAFKEAIAKLARENQNQ